MGVQPAAEKRGASCFLQLLQAPRLGDRQGFRPLGRRSLGHGAVAFRVLAVKGRGPSFMNLHPEIQGDRLFFILI